MQVLLLPQIPLLNNDHHVFCIIRIIHSAKTLNCSNLGSSSSLAKKVKEIQELIKNVTKELDGTEVNDYLHATE